MSNFDAPKPQRSILSLWSTAGSFVLQLCSPPGIVTAGQLPERQLFVQYPATLGYCSGSNLWDMGTDELFSFILYICSLCLAHFTIMSIYWFRSATYSNSFSKCWRRMDAVSRLDCTIAICAWEQTSSSPLPVPCAG